MAFEVKGTLHKKFDTENKTNTFRAREFVIEIEQGNYPQLIKFQLVQDRCEILDGFEEGDVINVFFDLRGREWNGKYFTNLQAWRIEKFEEAAPEMPPPPAAEPIQDVTEGMSMDDLPEDDLPF